MNMKNINDNNTKNFFIDKKLEDLLTKEPTKAIYLEIENDIPEHLVMGFVINNLESNGYKYYNILSKKAAKAIPLDTEVIIVNQRSFLFSEDLKLKLITRDDDITRYELLDGTINSNNKDYSFQVAKNYYIPINQNLKIIIIGNNNETRFFSKARLDFLIEKNYMNQLNIKYISEKYSYIYYRKKD